MNHLLNNQYYLTHPGLFTWLVLTVILLVAAVVAAVWIAIDYRKNKRTHQKQREAREASV